MKRISRDTPAACHLISVVIILMNASDEVLVIIEVQCGNYLGEDDIVRFDDLYGRN